MLSALFPLYGKCGPFLIYRNHITSTQQLARSFAPHLQLGLRRGHVLNLLELVEELEALGVEQRAARLDRLARDDALDGQLDLFAVDGDLRGIASVISLGKHGTRGKIQGTWWKE